MTTKTHIQATMDKIAQGVMAHLEQLGNMNPLRGWDEGEYESESYSAFCIAMQILGALHPETDEQDNWTGAEVREFAVACGMDKEHAEKVIHDDEPFAIY